MLPDYIYLNRKKISFDEIKSGDSIGETPFEQSTLAFCQQWINGNDHFILKTSGSTGKPTPITISRYQMQESAQQTIGFFNITPADTVLVCLNTAYIAGIMMLVRGFESGAKIIAVEPSGNPLLKLTDEIDFLAVVPLQLNQILKNQNTKKQIEACRATIVGGAPVSVKLEKVIQTSSAAIFATFGMTETLTHFALRQLSPKWEEGYTILEGTSISQDSRGCLTISSAVTEDKTIITNDLIEILTANSFKWLGRIDHVINSGGVKVQVETLEKKIEYIFHSLNFENRFFIGSVEDEVLGEKIVLYIECDNEDLKLKETDWQIGLDSFEKPKEVIAISKFIETPTGKINRRASAKRS
jgi:O-succinylbenzoic acid--CoA ligase